MSFLTKLFSGSKSQSKTPPATLSTQPAIEDWELISPHEAVSEAEDDKPASTTTPTPASSSPSNPDSTPAPARTPEHFKTRSKPRPRPTTQAHPPQTPQPNPLTSLHPGILTASAPGATEIEHLIKHHTLNHQRYKHSRLNMHKGNMEAVGQMPSRQPAVPPRPELLSMGQVGNFVWGKVWGREE